MKKEKIEFEVAAIYYLANEVLAVQPYFDVVPEGMIVPSIFYPTPEMETDSFSTGAYQTDFTLFVKLFARTTAEAACMASELLRAVAGKRNKVELVDEEGKKTGKNFRIDKLHAEKIDEGVYQLSITWKRYTAFDERASMLAKEFFMNGTPMEN